MKEKREIKKRSTDNQQPSTKKRIQSALSNIDEIATAVTKRVLHIDTEEAKRRQELCNSCDHAVPDPIFKGNMCELCLCPIKNLIYSNKNCNINKW